MITMNRAFTDLVPFAPAGATVPNALMKRVSAFAKVNQTAAIEWADYARQSYAEGQSALKRLAAARTPQAAFAIQTAYLKGSTERLMVQAKVLQDLYAGLAAGAAKPSGASA